MNPLRSLMSRYFGSTQHSHARKSPRGAIRDRKSARALLCLEPLEERCLLSAAISISDASAIEGSSALKFIDRFIPQGDGGLSADIKLGNPTLGPDGNLYVVGRGPTTNVNEILRYNGITGSYIDTFVASNSGGLNNPIDPEFGPDGNLYVSSFAGNQVLRYNGSTGAFMDVFVGGLSSPVGITFGSDGSLYIANKGTNEVLRYSNSVLSAFVTAGSGGLSQPRKAVFGPDGNLYVASQGTGQVLRYNGVTGSFIDTFATTGPTPGPAWLGFGTDGYLYTTQNTTAACCNRSFDRFDGTTGAFVDSYALGRDGWAFSNGPQKIIYDAANGAGGFVDRFGPSSLAAFTVSLDATSASPVSVDFATADGTAVAGTNYVAASGTVTIPAGMTSQTILIQTLDDGVVAANKTFTVNLSNPVGGTITRGQGTNTTIEGDATKFYVVDDAATDRTYRYALTGNAFASSTLAAGDTAPRGMAASADGSTIWVADSNKNVYVYGPSGTLLGSWSAGGLSGSAQVEGIASNGTDIWLLDNYKHKVYKYAGAASRRSGSQSAASSFSLSGSDSNAKGIVTDGTSFWVVDDGATSDMVYKYTLAGSSLGSWTIDAANSSPTGITINPNNVSDIWIVDSGTKRVYKYAAAAGLTSGSQSAAAIFALAANNTNPQDIADPPPPGLLPVPAPTILAPVPTVQPALLAPSATSRDAFFALLDNALSPWRLNPIAQRPASPSAPANLSPSAQAATIPAARIDLVFAGSQDETDEMIADVPLLPDSDSTELITADSEG